MQIIYTYKHDNIFPAALLRSLDRDESPQLIITRDTLTRKVCNAQKSWDSKRNDLYGGSPAIRTPRTCYSPDNSSSPPSWHNIHSLSIRLFCAQNRKIHIWTRALVSRIRGNDGPDNRLYLCTPRTVLLISAIYFHGKGRGRGRRNITGINYDRATSPTQPGSAAPNL